MKTLIFSLALICLPSVLRAAPTNGADAKPHALYVELLGGSTLVGLNYDARFGSTTHWGWRGGLSWAYSEANGFFPDSHDSRYWAVPLGVNYLLGSGRHSLELGLGASVGLVNRHYNRVSSYEQAVPQADFRRYLDDGSLVPQGAALFFDETSQQGYLVFSNVERRSKNSFGYYFFGDIGYRHTARSGFLFRAGLSPSFNFGDRYAISRGFSDTFHRFTLGAYLGFGWAF